MPALINGGFLPPGMRGVKVSHGVQLQSLLRSLLQL